jgi:hypothetical protein
MASLKRLSDLVQMQIRVPCGRLQIRVPCGRLRIVV